MRKLSDNVLLLGNNHFNYFIAGHKNAALIECGTSASTMLFAHEWSKLNHKPNINYIIALHSHFDHVCGIPTLKKLFPKAKIVASSYAKNILAKEHVIKSMLISDELVSQTYYQQSLIPKLPPALQIKSIPVDITVTENDILELDEGITLKFLDAQGHSPCSIACYLEPDKVMFVSDALGYKDEGQTISPTFFQNYHLYLDTISKLYSYTAKIVAPAHGYIAEGFKVDSFYEESLNEAKSAFNKIKEELETGTNEDEIADYLFKQYIKGGLALYPAHIMLSSMKLLVRNVASVINEKTN